MVFGAGMLGVGVAFCYLVAFAYWKYPGRWERWSRTDQILLVVMWTVLGTLLLVFMILTAIE